MDFNDVLFDLGMDYATRNEALFDAFMCLTPSELEPLFAIALGNNALEQAGALAYSARMNASFCDEDAYEPGQAPSFTQEETRLCEAYEQALDRMFEAYKKEHP